MPAHDLIPLIPADTARAARAVYSPSNIYLSIGNQLAALLADIELNNFSPRGAPSRQGKPSRALVTFFQYLEQLSDRQAAEATSARIDWKYALHLSMNYPGLDPIALCEFRQSLLRQPYRQQEFQRFLERLAEGGYAKEIQERPIETMRLLTEVCVRTRLDRVMSSMRHVLQALAIHDPKWLRLTSLPHWYSRYQMNSRQFDLTQNLEQQYALTAAIGEDMSFLLEAIMLADQPRLSSLNEVQKLYQVWQEQYSEKEGEVFWRVEGCADCNITAYF